MKILFSATLCVLAVAMFLAQPAVAAPPPQKQQHHSSGQQHHSSGQHHHSSGSWGNWHGQYPRYDVSPYRYYPRYTYSVPVVAAPLPQISVQIVNPAQNGVAMPFNIQGQAYWLAPGTQQDLLVTPGSVIQFSRGSSLGVAAYSLQPGIFSFSATPGGWELFQQPTIPSTNLAAPSPPAAIPAGPAPSMATPGTGVVR